MAKPATSALALISSNELRADTSQLSALQVGVVEQMRLMRRLRGEEALRGLLVGLMLCRVKHSLGHGEWSGWCKANVHQFGERYVNYLMRLALIFVDKARVAKPELLALPGDQTELTLDGTEGAQRKFMEKALKFVGDKSLHELFLAHGIKSAGKLGGDRERGQTNTGTPAALDPETLYQMARDEIGGAIDRAETLLLRENRLQHLVGHPDEVRGVVTSLRALADKVEAAAKPLLSA